MSGTFSSDPGLHCTWLGPQTADATAEAEPVRTPITLLHGFTQNSQCWGRFGSQLAADPTTSVLAVDLPGHGKSRHDDADLGKAAALVAAAAFRHHGQPSHWIGYSMGGRVALHGAAHGMSMRSLTLIGATPGIRTDDERHERAAADAARAEQLREGGLPAFLDEWLSLPLFAALDHASSCRDERLTNRAEGLAASLERCGTGQQRPLWNHLAQISTPLTVLAGEEDDKFCALGASMAEIMGSNAAFRSVPGAGHAAHLERPDLVAGMISARIVREDAP